MSDYFVMKGFADHSVSVLYDIIDPSEDDCWMWGRSFRATIQEPVEVTVVPDNDFGALLPLYDVPQIMHKNLYEALRAAGVDNIAVYKAIIRREDGSVVSEDYLAYNVIGVIQAADVGKTQFAPENTSRMIDASIEKLSIDHSRGRGLLLFRLAESLRTVVVHERVKEEVERRRIPDIVFLGENDYLF